VRRFAIFRFVLPLLMTTSVAAFDTSLDLRAIEEAIAAGQTRTDSVRQRFHDAYRLQVGRTPVDFIEVITPFRRVALAAEERARAGDRLFRQRDALDAAAQHGQTLHLAIELTFHPLNTYVGVPPYRVALARPGEATRVEPRDLQRIPRSQPRVSGASISPLPPGAQAPGQPVVGGTVLAIFDSTRLDPRGVYEVVIEEGANALARVRLDLDALR
jgi:hypothetical protein